MYLRQSYPASKPNNSFKPNLLRYSKSVAEKACHAFASTTQVGLTQALGTQKPLMPVLRPISDAEFAAWTAHTIPAYAKDKVASGAWLEAEALEKSRAALEALLPAGKETKDSVSSPLSRTPEK